MGQPDPTECRDAEKAMIKAFIVIKLGKLAKSVYWKLSI